MNDILEYLLCPNCNQPLEREGKSLVCPNRHTFDIAKSGYVNLLPPGKGKNARTGDDHGMVEARVNFLKRGFYDKISDTVAVLAAESANTFNQTNTAAVLGENQINKLNCPLDCAASLCNECISICDMGSGEGWHTCRAAQQIGAVTGKNTLMLGIDASKYAAECASKLSRRLGLMPKDGIGYPCDLPVSAYFIPANIFHTPTAEGSFTGAISMFAPVAWEEAFRIIKKDGFLIVVSSGKNHLLELRQLIYDNVHLSDDEITAPDIFKAADKQSLNYKITLPDKDSISDLFMMTPFCYKTSEAGRERLFSHDCLTVTVDVTYTVYKKAEN